MTVTEQELRDMAGVEAGEVLSPAERTELLQQDYAEALADVRRLEGLERQYAALHTTVEARLAHARGRLATMELALEVGP